MDLLFQCQLGHRGFCLGICTAPIARAGNISYKKSFSSILLQVTGNGASREGYTAGESP